MAGHDLHHQRGGPEAHRKQAGADHRVKDEGQEPGHRARIVPLRGDHVSQLGSGAHDCGCPSGKAGGWARPSGKAGGCAWLSTIAGAAGPGCLRRSPRCTQRSMN